VLNDFRSHPEPKSLGPDGKPSHRATVGWPSRRPVTPTSITYTGPQRKIEEAMAGLITNLDEMQMIYSDPSLAPVSNLVRRAIESFREPATKTAQEARVDRKTVLKARDGEPLDRLRRDALTSYAVDRVRAILSPDGRGAHVRNIQTDTLLTPYLERPNTHAVCAASDCSQLARRKSPFCSDACKQAARRRGE
jgi:hypothetical protein